MANYIDIKDFDGALTNADIEDLPDNVAQEIKNLKIQAGKLEKTFGAGTPSGIPYIGLTFVNDSFTPSKSYTVYNIFTFVSDKFEGDKNDAGDGYRYLLVTIEATDQTVKLFWWDSSLPDVTDHLQVEDNIMWFSTSPDAHGITATDYVLVQDCKDNASPQADISGAGVYEQADHVPSTTTVGVNTDNATGWGGSFFDTTVPSGAVIKPFGGKCQTHTLAVDTVDWGSPSQNVGKVSQIAIASMNGKVLSLAVAVTTNGDQIDVVYYNGTSVADLSETNYNSYKTKTNFKVCSMIGFNNAVYVHYSYTDTTNYNPVAKYTLSSGGSVDEVIVSSNLSTNDNTATSFMHIAGGDLYVLVEDNGLYKINTSDSVSTVNFTGISPALDLTKLRGITSITQTNKLTSAGVSSGSDVAHRYLVVAVATSSDTRCQLYAHDLSDGANANWYAQGSAFNATSILGLSSMDFGENSSRSESVVIHYVNSSDNYLKYTSHNDTSVINSYSHVSSGVFTDSTVVAFIASTYNSPGTKYLVVGTDDVSSPSQVNGKLYIVGSDKSPKIANEPGTSAKATWNPTCFADCVTETHGGQDFFEHAKGYIGVYGTESSTGSPSGESGDIYRMTDIGWLANTWNGSGDCEYRWIDVGSRYDLDTLYHKKDRSPIVPFGDTLRVLPGNIAKVGSNETKGAWVGWIDRSLFNGNKVYGPSFFAKENRLTNPFTFKNVELSLTDEEIRISNTVKYTLTAVYDGVQETPIQDEAIRQIVTNSGDDDDVSKSEIKLIVDLPISTMNERITGLNVYRAEKISGVYETYKLVISYSFVDIGDDSLTVSTSSDTNLITNLEAFDDKTIFIKDQDDAIKDWLNDGTVQNLTSDQGSITDNNYYSYTGANFKYAIKVGSFTKQHIEKIDAITGYEATGATLNEDLTTTDTTITVNNVSNISDSYPGVSVYKIGSRDLSIGTAQGDEDDDDEGYERIKVTGISGNDLTVTRGWDGSAGDATLAREHSKFDPIKADTGTVTGWYKIVTDDDIKGRRHDESWKIYKAKIPGPLPGGWNTQIGTKSEGAFAGKYMGIIIPQPSEDSNGDFTMAPWRDTDGTMKLSSILAKKFTATKSSPSETQTFKIEKAYTSWDEQLGITFIETDKAFQSSNWTDPEVIISTFSDISTVVSDSLNEITVIDKGLSSLDEHPYGQEDKIKVNAQYAKILKGRLFLGNIVLDPGNENEAQNDWVAYSELNAYDVRPVSNVIPFPDREGGQITGLSELFGRLIVFKAQAIFVLDVVDPSDSTTWARKETKINIGNIAPDGLAEVHDSVYFVHHDGIYKLDANTVASSDATPSIMEKITLGIEDQFLLANDKKSIKGVYDQKNNEILYTWEVGSPATQVVWAYHIVLKTWRKVETTTNLNILTFGENSGPLAWDETDKDLKKFDVSEAVGTAWKSKRFRLDLDRKRLIRYGTVKYSGNDVITANMYIDGDSSASFTKTLTPSTVVGSNLALRSTFDSGTTGWTAISGNPISNVSGAVKMTWILNTYSGYYYFNLSGGNLGADLTPGFRYRVQVDARIDKGGSQDNGGNVGVVTTSNAWGTYMTSIPDSSDSMSTYTVDFVAEDSNDRLTFKSSGYNNGEAVYVDNIILKQMGADKLVSRFPIKRYGKNFEIELTTPSSTNAFSVEQLRIETE